jgi:hypothetical protein
VTITSPDEQVFVQMLLTVPPDGPTSFILWTGGFKRRHPGNPAAGWHWVTREPFGFTNWELGEPDNKGGGDDRVEILADGSWRDAPGSFRRQGYIVEYDTPAE